MNKTKKITIFIFLAVPLLFFFTNKTQAAGCSAGRTCQIRNDSLDCVSEGVCPGTNPNDKNYQLCCKPKISTAGTSAQASATGNSGLIPASHKVDGNYSINDLLQVAVNVSNKIFGLAGSAALLAFVYGGMTMVISAGSQEKVAKGKAILIGAVIGLVIVFTGYLIVDTVAKGLDKKGGPWNTSKP